MKASASLLSLLVLLSACSTASETGLEREIGPEGGELIAGPDSAFAGFSLKIPAGALSAPVTVRLEGTYDHTPLPDTAERVGVFVRIQPEGTVLARPAELTVPIDPSMMEDYEGKPEACKVWARSGAGWERLEALRSTLDTVTVPLSTFTTAAAGVVFTNAKQACTTTNPCTLAALTPVEQCASLSTQYCLVKLAKPTLTDFIDEFASVTVVDNKVYWVAQPDDGGITVYRYDLDNPGPVFQYPKYITPPVGTIATRGRVAVVSSNEVWAAVTGYGNIRFNANADAVAFDRPSTATSSAGPVGVVAESGGAVQRFRRVPTPGAGDRFDILEHQGGSNTSKFVYTHRRIRVFNDGSSVTSPAEQVFGVFNGSTALLSSTNRGPGKTFDPGDLVRSTGFWGVEFAVAPQAGRDADSGTQPYRNATFRVGAPTEWVAGPGPFISSIVSWWTNVGNNPNQLIERVALPNVVRDVAFIGGTLLAISSGRTEFYTVSNQNALSTIALPTDEVGMSPFRIREIPGTSDALLITRGPLINKGEFYRIRKLR